MSRAVDPDNTTCLGRVGDDCGLGTNVFIWSMRYLKPTGVCPGILKAKQSDEKDSALVKRDRMCPNKGFQRDQLKKIWFSK